MLNPNTWIISCDLGSVIDYSAISLVHFTEKNTFEVRHLERLKANECDQLAPWHVGGRDFYTKLMYYLLSKVEGPVARLDPKQTLLVFDSTGIGRQVADKWLKSRLCKVLRCYPIQIRAQATAEKQYRNGCIQVGRAELLQHLAVIIDSQRLAFAADLPLATELKTELKFVKTKEERYSTEKRISVNDDLALSVAMAVYLGEKLRSQGQAGYIPVQWN